MLLLVLGVLLIAVNSYLAARIMKTDAQMKRRLDEIDILVWRYKELNPGSINRLAKLVDAQIRHRKVTKNLFGYEE